MSREGETFAEEPSLDLDLNINSIAPDLAELTELTGQSDPTASTVEGETSGTQAVEAQSDMLGLGVVELGDTEATAQVNDSHNAEPQINGQNEATNEAAESRVFSSSTASTTGTSQEKPAGVAVTRSHSIAAGSKSSPRRRTSWADSLAAQAAVASSSHTERTGSTSSNAGGIRVFCRVRPLNVAESHQQQLLFPPAASGVVKPPEVIEFVSNRQINLIKPNVLQSIIYQRQRQVQSPSASPTAATPASAGEGAGDESRMNSSESSQNQTGTPRAQADATADSGSTFVDDTHELTHDSSSSYTPFHFDYVFTPLSTQQQCFAEVRDTAISALDGYNTCVFAYGQTGSGKTHTMFGTPTEPGLVPRTIAALFDEIDRRGQQYEYTISATLIEIYNEQIRDLFSKFTPGGNHVADRDASASRPGVQFSRMSVVEDDPNPNDEDANEVGEDLSSTTSAAGGSVSSGSAAKLRIRPSRRGMYIENCVKATCSNRSDLLALVEEGSTLRAVGSTLLNQQSTRSHVVLQLLVDGVDVMTQVRTYGKVTLVDLAGSERLSAVGNQGQRLVETGHINKSLSALGDVFLALANRQASQNVSQQESGGHIPYRNSKLTYLLQDSIGGNSRTIMFVAVSPSYIHHNETSNSLMFARRVKSIKLDPATANVDTAQAQRFRQQIDQLKRRLEAQQQAHQKQLRSLEKALEDKDATLNKIIAERNSKTQMTNAVIAQLTLEVEEMRRAMNKDKRDESKLAKDRERFMKEKNRADLAERQVRELTTQRDSLSSRVTQLEAELGRTERTLQQRTEERDTQAAKAQALQQQVHNLQQQLHAAQSQIQQLQLRTNTLQTQLQQAQSQSQSARHVTSSASNFVEFESDEAPQPQQPPIPSPRLSSTTLVPPPPPPASPPVTPLISRARADRVPSSAQSRLAPRTPSTSQQQARRGASSAFATAHEPASSPLHRTSTGTRMTPATAARRADPLHSRSHSELPRTIPIHSPSTQRGSDMRDVDTREKLRDYQARRIARMQQSQSTGMAPGHGAVGAATPQALSTASRAHDVTATKVTPRLTPAMTAERQHSPPVDAIAPPQHVRTASVEAREAAYLAQIQKKHGKQPDTPLNEHDTDNDSGDAISFQAVIVTPPRARDGRRPSSTMVTASVSSSAPILMKPPVPLPAVTSPSALTTRPPSPPVDLPPGWSGDPPQYNASADDEDALVGSLSLTQAPAHVDTLLPPGSPRRSSMSSPKEDKAAQSQEPPAASEPQVDSVAAVARASDLDTLEEPQQQEEPPHASQDSCADPKHDSSEPQQHDHEESLRVNEELNIDDASQDEVVLLYETPTIAEQP